MPWSNLNLRGRGIIYAPKEDIWDYTGELGDVIGLAEKLVALDPDLVLIDLATPSRVALEQISAASNVQSRYIAVFVDRSDDKMTQATVMQQYRYLLTAP